MGDYHGRGVFFVVPSFIEKPATILIFRNEEYPQRCGFSSITNQIIGSNMRLGIEMPMATESFC